MRSVHDARVRREFSGRCSIESGRNWLARLIQLFASLPRRSLADVAVHHELVAERVAGEDWARADALIVYYGVPIDRSLVERLDSCRILVRAGVGYDHINIAACAARGPCRRRSGSGCPGTSARR